MNTEVPLERVLATTSQLLLEVFGRGTVHYAVAGYDGKGVTYQPIDKPLDLHEIERHLGNEQCLGCYQLLPDSTVRWIAWDVDSPDLQKAREFTSRISGLLNEKKIPHGIEWSGHKGYHILLILDEPMAASEAKIFAESIRGMLAMPATGKDHVECFPKQAKLATNNKYGNLLKMPLGWHPKTHQRSRFVDPQHAWEQADRDIDPKEILSQRVSRSQLQQWIKPVSPLDKIAAAIAPVWISGNRHDLALSLSGYLVNNGWGVEVAKDLMSRICDVTADEDVINRVQCVIDTFVAVQSGKTVMGFSRLQELVPATILQEILGYSGEISTSTIVRQMDRIRLAPKRPGFMRERDAVTLIWNFLSESGQVLKMRRDHDDHYWYCNEDHALIRCGTSRWNVFMHSNFGLDVQDSFGMAVNRQLGYDWNESAAECDVHRRSSWDGNRLFVHLDGPEVYILDGQTITLGYNGECGLMFHALGEDRIPIELPFEPDEQFMWQHLVDDLNFERTETSPSTPEQQRELLRAWITSFFFPELMTSRPIIVCLGNPGSGKTSAMRRLLHIIESPFSDVLELITDKPDALRSTLESHKLVVLDNMEQTHVPGLTNTLSRLATGMQMELRKLYTTNEAAMIRPDVFMAITAVNLPFNDEALFSRLLPLQLKTIAQPIPEQMLQQSVITNRVAIWQSLLTVLNSTVRSLHDIPEGKLEVNSRLADFSSFCQRLRGVASIRHATLMSGLVALAPQQEILLGESSSIIDLISYWLDSSPTEHGKPLKVSKLYNELRSYAKLQRTKFPWGTTGQLEQHLNAMSHVLETKFGCSIADGAGGITLTFRPHQDQLSM